jgi:dynein heavy chain, axonemal
VLGEVADDDGASDKYDGHDAEGSTEANAEQKEKEAAEKRRALYDIMTCMRDIRKRTERTDAMFEPLKDTVKWTARLFD